MTGPIGRSPGGFGGGADWLVGKGHDTFAPQGPWIVPKEFYGDPMKNLRQTLSVGGTQLQEARAGDMIHSLWELIEYASSITTLFPGDVINNGTSGGTAAGSAKTRAGDRFLKPGEVIEASIDGIGTLRMPVVAGAQPPGGPGRGCLRSAVIANSSEAQRKGNRFESDTEARCSGSVSSHRLHPGRNRAGVRRRWCLAPHRLAFPIRQRSPQPFGGSEAEAPEP